MVLPENSTRLSLRITAIFYKFGQYVLSVPFRYSFSKKSFCHGPVWKRILWIITQRIILSLELAQATRELIRVLLDKTVNQGECSLVFFAFVGWVLVFFLHRNTLKNGNEIINYVNSMYNVREYFGEDAMPTTKNYITYGILLFLCFPQCTSQSAMLVQEAEKKQYLYSILPEEYRNVGTRTFYTFFCIFRVCSNFGTVCFYLMTSFLHCQTVQQVTQIRDAKNMTLSERLKTYRMLQLLSNRYNAGCAKIYIPTFTAFAVVNIILGCFGTIRFHDQVDPSAYGNFPSMSILATACLYTSYSKYSQPKEFTEKEVQFVKKRYLGQMNPTTDHQKDYGNKVLFRRQGTPPGIETVSSEDSHLAISTVRNDLQTELSRQRKEILTILRSCRPVALEMGSFYQIKKSTKLSIFEFITCNTITALITI
ncbi:unnamed protein product [Allacma fusca]|uniref:Uncharacterized protein n=1 Tax=Allacma fusca TaxID=39272 RepID=A0A8J2LCI4_9HEXA|nr:unnamed protein product [Allacma fusca]